MKKLFHSLVCTIFAITISIVYLSPFSLLEANPVGFSVDLIHRDSPSSPLYNSSLSHFERVSRALYRSINRVKYYTRASTTPRSAFSDVISDDGEYLMKITIGTPPVSILAIADTGSDLIWTQCMPCNDCYKQKAPFFDPRSSSTYKEAPCGSRACQTLGQNLCNGTCQYIVSYGDGSYSQGILATETVTLSSTTRRPMSLPKIIFGCGYENDGTFSENGSGIIGLGGGPFSLISQLPSSIGDKFSYCLVPLSSHNTKSSRMNFGQKAIVSGNRVVSTPITRTLPHTFYFLTLEGFSVGRQRLEFYNSSSSPNAFGSFKDGNIIIDSGTTVTILPSNVYSRLESAVRSAIEEEPIPDPKELLDLCYKFSNEISFPIITAHFTGADVKLSHLNTFIKTSSDVVCFAFAATESNIAIFGNVAQMNFLVGYDIRKRIVSFKPMDCARE